MNHFSKFLLLFAFVLDFFDRFLLLDVGNVRSELEEVNLSVW